MNEIEVLDELPRGIPPGEVLHRDFLIITDEEHPDENEGDQAIAKTLRCSLDFASCFRKGLQPVTRAIAEELAAKFKTTVEFWLNLQKNYERRAKSRELYTQFKGKHPGLVLDFILKIYGSSQMLKINVENLANALDVSQYNLYNQFMRGENVFDLTQDRACKLAEFTNTTSTLWIMLQLVYEKTKVKEPSKYTVTEFSSNHRWVKELSALQGKEVGSTIEVTEDLKGNLRNFEAFMKAVDHVQALPDRKLHMQALIGEYWELAYREGKEGRNHDTPEGDAQRVLSSIIEELDRAFVTKITIKTQGN